MCNVIETEIDHGNYPPFTLRPVFFSLFKKFKKLIINFSIKVFKIFRIKKIKTIN
jgi:hypothetical protein